MGRRNAGQVLIMFVLALFVLLGFVALGIDVGYMYSVRNDLQRSADSGALAGAYIFNNGGWVTGQPAPGTLRPDAENRARYFAAQDPVATAPLDSSEIDVSFPYDTDSTKVNQITVTAQRNVNLFFAGIIGIPAVALSANATAEAIPVDQNMECLTPLAFPYPYTDASIPPNHRWDPGEPRVFPASIPQGLHVSFLVADPDSSVLPIPSYVMNGIGGIGGTGEIFPVRMCGDSSGGESDLRTRIRTPCGDGCSEISLNDTLSLKDNPTYMPAIDEINRRLIGGDPGASWDPGSNLPSSPDPRYSGDNWMLSPRVVRVMLYDPQDARTFGRIRVTGFAGFWIESVDNPPSWPNNADISGYFIPDAAVGGISTLPPIAPSLKTTRLVQ